MMTIKRLAFGSEELRELKEFMESKFDEMGSTRFFVFYRRLSDLSKQAGFHVLAGSHMDDIFYVIARTWLKDLDRQLFQSERNAAEIQMSLIAQEIYKIYSQ